MGHLGGRSMSTQRDSSSVCLTVLGWMFKCPASCFVAPWWMQSVLFPSASVDHLHLPPTPPSSHSSDSEGSLSPSPRLHPFGLAQTHSPARAPARAPSALASSPLLTAPHVSVPASGCRGNLMPPSWHLELHPAWLPFRATWLFFLWEVFSLIAKAGGWQT